MKSYKYMVWKNEKEDMGYWAADEIENLDIIQ